MVRDFANSWSETWARSQRIRDFVPLRLTGLLLVLMAFGSREYWGIDQSDFVIRSAASLVLIVTAIMILAIIIAAVALHRSIARLPNTSLVGSIEAGEMLPNGLAFSRFRWWPFVQTDLQWAHPSAVEVKLDAVGCNWVERVRPLERGHFERVTRRFTVRDIFGLASVSLTRSWPAGIRVQPRRAGFEIEQVLRNVAEDGYAHPTGQPIGDIIEMRRYAPGDPLNRIVWRTFARNRELYVREPERAIATLPTNAIYFVAGEDDERSAEFVRAILEKGLLGDDIIFGADGCQSPAYNRVGALECLIESAQHRDQGGQGLMEFARFIQAQPGSHCLVCLPGADGPWVTHLEQFVRAMASPPAFMVTVDGQCDQQSTLSRWLWRTDGAVAFDGRALGMLYAHLEVLGGPIQVISASESRALSRPEVMAMGRS